MLVPPGCSPMCSEFPGPCPRPAAPADPCALSCGASRVLIFPPPVLITFPGPILSTCPQDTVLGSPGMPEGSPGTPAGGAGTPPSSHGAQFPRFVPKFRPVPGADPREAALGCSGMLQGGTRSSRSSLRSHGAPIPHSGAFIPHSGPRRASRCSYVFNSRWIHPCRRSGGGIREPAGNGAEEPAPAPDKAPGTEDVDVTKEEKEVLEV